MSRKGKSSQPIIYVRTSKDEIEKWDRKKILEALIRETDIEQNLAEKISQEVEEQIISSKLTTVTASLIRELVDTKLVEYGLEEARKKHARLGVPLYDTEQAILYPSKENANIPHNPEASNLVLAEQIKKQFALAKVFSQDVADAHMRGDIHLHDLGYPDRPYCSGQNLEYIKKFGLKLPFWATAKPARHPEVLLEQMIKMSAALQGHFAGAIGWDAVNLFFAPYLVGLSDKEIHQLAQMMIFEFSQQSVARGGQSLAHDEGIFIYDEIDEKLMVIPIGKFAEKFLEGNSTSEFQLAQITEPRYKAISFDRKTRGIKLAKIYAVSKHKRRSKLVKIKTNLGQEINVTEDHSIFTIDGKGRILQISPSHKPEIILGLLPNGLSEESLLASRVPLSPLSVQRIDEQTSDHGFVYDISVQGTENFLTAQGIFAHNTIFSDLNLYWEVPKHFQDVPTIGPGGEYTGKTYRDYLKEAQKFVWALFDVYKEGDAQGKPFFFPKPLLHITSKFFETPGHERFLNHISEVASLKGNTYFVFDRGDTYRINECLTKDTKVLVKIGGTIYYSSIEDVYKMAGDGEGWKNLKNLEVLSIENGVSKFKAAKGILKRYHTGEIIEIELEDGSSIKVTPKHPSLVLQNGTLSVTHSIELKPGDYMPTTKGARNGHLNFLKIKSIKREPCSGYVYDFEMADDNNPIFQLPNGIVTHNCCRLAFELDSADLAEAKQPWKMRYSTLQNVSINLPRVAYLSKGKEEELLDKITQLMELAAKAHLQKRAFLEKLLRMGEKGPLALLAIELDGEPYLRMHRATHLFGIVGLNELVQTHTGRELHESEEALKFGLKIISHMKLTANKLSKKHGLRFVLEQTPAEHVAYRFATLDMKHFPKEASRVVKGNIDLGEIYYTNSAYLNVGAPIDPIERVTIEGMFHPLIEAGWLSHIWLGEAQPPPESIANFVTKVFKNTNNSQIAFSPEFTSCLNCGKITRGLLDSCPCCGSEDVEGITRITGYFSRTTRWNKGKLGELKDRHRVTIDPNYGPAKRALERLKREENGKN